VLFLVVIASAFHLEKVERVKLNSPLFLPKYQLLFYQIIAKEAFSEETF